ncbi:hypothetical protein HAX54_024213 [Datura stramonium]|uniref:Uncharacterized protein n=1 Tax=Datura stramonium TaxID=4076 RepID=A0ABS8S697_DATST|nr:hypothetical protein [Datura stramonium]
MLGFDAPFNQLRVKGASGRGRKKKKADSEDDSDGSDGDDAGSSRPTGLFQQMEANFIAMPQVPQLSPRDVPEYSFLSGGEDKEASDPDEPQGLAYTLFRPRCSGNLIAAVISP